MLLSIQDLKVAFRVGKVDGVVQRALAVKGVSFDIPEHSTVALVGESGSGKSVTAMSILNLLPDNAERSGQILFQGRDLLKTSLRQLQAVRGREIACVFQDPMSSLNPVFTVADQIMEPLMKHLGMSVARRWCGRKNCSMKSASPIRNGACAAIRTRCPAASSSG